MRSQFSTNSYKYKRIAKGVATGLVLLAPLGIFLYTLLLAVTYDPAFKTFYETLASVSHATPIDESNNLTTEAQSSDTSANLNTSDSGDRIEEKIRGKFRDVFWVMLVASLIFLVHATYLGVVAWNQLIKHPIEQFHWGEAIPLIMLCLVYFIPLVFVLLVPEPINEMLHDLSNSKTTTFRFRFEMSKLITTFVFFAVYAGWSIIDYREINHFRKHAAHSELPNKKVPLQKLLWMGLDSFLAFTLFGAIVLYLAFQEEKLYKLTLFTHITIKELAVSLAVAAHFFMFVMVRLAYASDEPIKHRGYQKALNRQYKQTAKAIPKPKKGESPLLIPVDTDHADEEGNELPCNQYCDIVIQATSVKRISEAPLIEVPLIKCMIINCGTGRRTAQLIRRLKVRPPNDPSIQKDHYCLELFAYHHDKIARDDFLLLDWAKQLPDHPQSGIEHPENITCQDFTTDIETAQTWASQADVIILLHSTYNQEEAARVESVLAKVNARSDQPAAQSKSQKEQGDAPVVDKSKADLNNKQPQEGNANKPRSQVILARGFADHSLLAAVCHQHPELLFPRMPHYHLWNHGFLREMAAGHGWHILHPYCNDNCPAPVSKPNSPPTPEPDDSFYPFKIITQNLNLKGSSLDDAMSYLALQINERAVDGLYEQLKAIASATPIKELPKNQLANADDYVYCFVTPGNDGIPDKGRVRLEYQKDYQTAAQNAADKQQSPFDYTPTRQYTSPRSGSAQPTSDPEQADKEKGSDHGSSDPTQES